MSNNQFEADEIISTKKKIQEIPINEKEVENLHAIDYLKIYRLNDEGLLVFIKAAKKKRYQIQKSMFFGTLYGYAGGLAIEVLFKNIKEPRRDYIKAGCVIFCTMVSFFLGYSQAQVEFVARNNEIIRRYGKEV